MEQAVEQAVELLVTQTAAADLVATTHHQVWAALVPTPKYL
jgi:hypothetical protein